MNREQRRAAAKGERPIDLQVFANQTTMKVTLVFNRPIDNLNMPIAEAIRIGTAIVQAAHDLKAKAEAGVPS